MASQEVATTVMKRKHDEVYSDYSDSDYLDDEDEAKRVHLEVDTTVAEGRFWTLAVKLTDMICAFVSTI
jgi:hypothetical protein